MNALDTPQEPWPRWRSSVNEHECTPTCGELLVWAMEQSVPVAEKLLLVCYANDGSTSIQRGIEFTGLPEERVVILTHKLRVNGYLPMPADIQGRPAERTPWMEAKKQRIPSLLRWEVFKRDDFRCRACGSRDHLAADHIFPESLGGEMALENLQTLCRSCNSKKGVRI